MKARRFSRMASRPCQSATPRLHTASSAKQSMPLPKVLSSISFHMAKSQSGAAVFVKVIVFIYFLPIYLFNASGSYLRHTAINREVDASDETAVVRSQEQNRRCYFF